MPETLPPDGEIQEEGDEDPEEETPDAVLIRAMEHIDVHKIKKVLVIFANDTRPLVAGWFSNMHNPIERMGYIEFIKGAMAREFEDPPEET